MSSFVQTTCATEKHRDVLVSPVVSSFETDCATEKPSGDVDDTTDAQQLIELPADGAQGKYWCSYSECECLLWLRVSGVYAASVLASGVLWVWPVVQPYFEAEGVYAEYCNAERRNDTADRSFGGSCEAQDMMLSQLYLVTTNLLLVATWPIGLFFDAFGARLTAAWGSLFCCLGGVLLVLTVYSPSVATSLLLPGLILFDFGSTMNSFGLYGFLWHFHDKQGLLSGLANSTYSVSCMVPLALLQWFDLELTLLLSVGLSVCALVLCLLLVPTSAEYFNQAERILGQPFEKPSVSPSATIHSCFRVSRVFQANTLDNTLFSVSFLFMMASGQYYYAVLWPFLKRLLHSESAATMVSTAGTTVYGVLGFFLAPVIGYVSDITGMRGLVYLAG